MIIWESQSIKRGPMKDNAKEVNMNNNITLLLNNRIPKISLLKIYTAMGNAQLTILSMDRIKNIKKSFFGDTPRPCKMHNEIYLFC